MHFLVVPLTPNLPQREMEFPDENQKVQIPGGQATVMMKQRVSRIFKLEFEKASGERAPYAVKVRKLQQVVVIFLL
jgi:hypothetical protein